MQFESKLDIGQIAFAINNQLPVMLTVGKITIEHTDSPGLEGEKLFNNYMPQKSHSEKYMCIETGIGTGTVWEYGRNIFSTYEECTQAILANSHKG